MNKLIKFFLGFGSVKLRGISLPSKIIYDGRLMRATGQDWLGRTIYKEEPRS